jgi:carbon-monoxide dehydrogenase medium subunit
MSTWTKYVVAQSIGEALDALATAPGPACPISGGTDLLLDLQQGRHSPQHTLVDLTRIPELNRLELTGNTIYIGAAVPMRIITQSPLICEHALALSEACGLVGGPQVRNTATLGGNVAHALPAADGMIALCALDAQAEIASPEGRRLQPMLSLFKGPGVSTLDLGREILVGFHVQKRQPGQASAFGRVMRPQGVALPIINLAVWLDREKERVKDIRIVVGPSGPVPLRATDLEICLRGQEYTPTALSRAIESIQTSLRFRSSPQRASAAYRYQLCEVLLDEVISSAWERAEMVGVV